MYYSLVRVGHGQNFAPGEKMLSLVQILRLPPTGEVTFPPFNAPRNLLFLKMLPFRASVAVHDAHHKYSNYPKNAKNFGENFWLPGYAWEDIPSDVMAGGNPCFGGEQFAGKTDPKLWIFQPRTKLPEGIFHTS